MAIKFEKKVILGSITSFLVAAIGIIAVFFPSVFNLEKKKMQELSITLKNADDALEIWKFLEKNQGKVVALNINFSDNNGEFFKEYMVNKKDKEDRILCGSGKLKFKNGGFYEGFYFEEIRQYKHKTGECSDNLSENVYGDKNYNYEAEIIKHLGKANLDRDFDDSALDKKAMKAQFDVLVGGVAEIAQTADDGFLGYDFPQGGEIAFCNFFVLADEWGESQLCHTIMIPHATNNGKKYMFSGEQLKGVFFVNDFESIVYTPTNIEQLIQASSSGESKMLYQKAVLDPFDKKDLEMRNY
ncbi:hypothetical protein LS71_000735 [Helicobacter jaachi]|uniref:Uncharacterized protein n=1 Tax=Helicobacter jaachi TaxID=1677920 RepID=A0A4U8TBN7_9HELI|nr:hypothetical protein [Helicobacter jaachi]TLD97315.1 hypothetical protein LS71_000735 [Helicobacter jaachi]